MEDRYMSDERYAIPFILFNIIQRLPPLYSTFTHSIYYITHVHLLSLKLCPPMVFPFYPLDVPLPPTTSSRPVREPSDTTPTSTFRKK